MSQFKKSTPNATTVTATDTGQIQPRQPATAVQEPHPTPATDRNSPQTSHHQPQSPAARATATDIDATEATSLHIKLHF
jgi:hypothetical protein